MSTLLHIDSISTGYHWNTRNEVILHDNISAQVSNGEMVCMLGPNGAGKSTFMRTILGFEPLHRGQVYFDKKSLTDLSVHALAKKVAVVLTDRIDDNFLSAYEVVSSGRYPYASFTGRLKETDHQHIVEALALVGASALSSRFFRELSDGEKQRVLLARALAQDTDLIFLDEPAAFIDSPGKVELMELLRSLCQQNDKGILITTHDMEPALRFADKLWLFADQRHFQEGSPEQLIRGGSINSFFDTEEVVFNPENRRFEKRIDQNS